AAATGGSAWAKYMHPKYQKRIFFPELWSEQERENWGHEV
ncbi:tryptophan 2,3-dioxygenase, partial [Flavobacteriaceae bacterium]|nr:tryptophan 2,3-dioxygenase [Flavobacteriaceae bacterium]